MPRGSGIGRGRGEPLPPYAAGRSSELDALSSSRGHGGRAGAGGGSYIGAPNPEELEALIQLPPPELAIWPAGRALYAAGRNAAIANATSADVAQLELLDGHVGVINSWIIFGVNLVVGLAATFQLLIDGSPVQGGTRELPPQNSASASISWGPQEILFRIPSGSTVAVRITVTAGGPADLGSQISGHEYPATLDTLYSSAWRQ